MLVAITGVSGSGKSTLVHQVLYGPWRAPRSSTRRPLQRSIVATTESSRFNDVVLVDQTPIGRTPRSNPITYIKGFDLVANCLPRSLRPSGFRSPQGISSPRARRPLQTCEGDRQR